MKKLTLYLPVILSLFILFSCGNQGKKESEKNVKSSASPGYKMESVFVAEDGCLVDSLENCTHVIVEYPVFTDARMSPANRFINHRLADIMGYGDAESDSLVDLKKAARHIINDYAEFKKDFPDSPQIWNLRSMTHVIYEDSNIVSLKMLTESYMGGAHGSLAIGYLNFDKGTGKSVNLLSRIKDTTRFIEMVEKKFREKRHIPTDSTLEAAGFWFPGNKFTLPANIGMDAHGYLLHYNPYEVAPYSMGPTDIVIGFNELETK
jgi:hypothetical protein